MALADSQTALHVDDGSVVRGLSSVSNGKALSGVHPGAASEVLVASFVGDREVKKICGCEATGNMRVLFLTAVLFIIITTAQAFAAFSANSKALLADCYFMGVDAGTYFLNMFAETMRGSPLHRPLELLIAFVSQAILVYFCVGIILNALDGLKASDGGGEDVDPNIVLVFALFGLIFDFISLGAFVKNQRQIAGAWCQHDGSAHARGC